MIFYFVGFDKMILLCVSNYSLLAAFGLPQQVFAQSASALRQVATAAQVSALLREPPELPALLQATRQWLAQPGTATGDPADANVTRRIVTLAMPTTRPPCSPRKTRRFCCTSWADATGCKPPAGPPRSPSSAAAAPRRKAPSTPANSRKR